MKDINKYNLEFNFYDDKSGKYIKKEIPSLIEIKKKDRKYIFNRSCFRKRKKIKWKL